MTQIPIAPSFAMDLFHRLGQRLPQLGQRELAQELAPLLGRFQGPLPAAETAPLTDAALAFCRRLYASARSVDALPLARAVLAQSTWAADANLMRRASTACGLLSADAADVAGALEHHAQALRLARAADDRVEMSRIWNNIGLAIAVSGNYEMAGRCYQRALAYVEDSAEAEFSRYAACVNLANSLSQTGAVQDGLKYANRALDELIPAFVDQDPYAVMVLRRNLVRLLLSAGQVSEAESHVRAVAALADQLKTPRALITAATTRAAYELATGRSDVALTRLDQALTRAREAPGILSDTLICVIRAEEAAGNAERALMRLQELSDHVYRFAIQRARANLEIAPMAEFADPGGDRQREQDRARLVSKVAPPSEPDGWDTLRRLAIGAAMRMDETGWHGVRVGALTKGLAQAWGCPPLQALEYGLAAELHDVGMLSVPEAILSKRGALNEGELALVRRHVEAGAEILCDDRHPRVLMAREIARYHHAHWDGNGYPDRVGGRFIPLAARMCAVADAYDVMVCGLAGRAPRTMDEAMAEIHHGAGTQFDPDLVRCFDLFIRTEIRERGLDLSSSPGMEGFQDLIISLQDDRGFI